MAFPPPIITSVRVTGLKTLMASGLTGTLHTSAPASLHVMKNWSVFSRSSFSSSTSSMVLKALRSAESRLILHFWERTFQNYWTSYCTLNWSVSSCSPKRKRTWFSGLSFKTLRVFYDNYMFKDLSETVEATVSKSLRISGQTASTFRN